MKNKKEYFFIIFIFFLVGFFLISQSFKNKIPQIPENIKYVNIAGQNIKVDLALTGSEQEQGLSGREGLKDNEGMLFVFAKPGEYSFWMKDMKFPIDIIWLSEGLKVIYIKDNALPELYPETYRPVSNDGDAKYVLEVNSGFSKKNNLKIGDSVLFTY
jgi:uncharacterized protein